MGGGRLFMCCGTVSSQRCAISTELTLALEKIAYAKKIGPQRISHFHRVSFLACSKQNKIKLPINYIHLLAAHTPSKMTKPGSQIQMLSPVFSSV